MASSNRHWPSMFKSKPSNSHNQGQHEMNSTFVSSGYHRPSPYAPVPGGEERSPEPKPRWNPKPEQIRILEAIFNSGMVNPPRDEIRKIRAQLQEYGQVGDANVFYWFQNRKSRSKHKLRHLQKSQVQTQHTTLTKTSQANNTSSSSSSSEKSSPKGSNKGFPISSSSILMDPSNSPTGSVNQTFFQTQPQGEFLQEPFFFPVQQTPAGTINFSSTQGFCFSGLSNFVHQVPEQQTVGPCTSLLLSEIMNHNGSSSMKVQEGKMIKSMQQQQQQQFSSCYSNMSTGPLNTHSTAINLPSPTTTFTIPSPINQVQGMVELGGDQMGPAARSMVYINDVAIEVGTGPFNVRGAFGDDVLLLHISGQPVMTNEFGVTLQPLQPGGSYHLISLKQCDWGASRENLDNLFV